jgi:hypothetical protein
MENNLDNAGTPGILRTPYEREFEIDYSKIKTVDDLVLIFKAMQLTVHSYDEDMPENIKVLYDKGYLIELPIED